MLRRQKHALSQSTTPSACALNLLRNDGHHKSCHDTLCSDVKIPLSFEVLKVSTPSAPSLKGPESPLLKLTGPFMRLKGRFPLKIRSVPKKSHSGEGPKGSS